MSLLQTNSLNVLDIAAWNDVWAHIEACASIVTACLPTLVPLFTNIRTPESMIRSVKAILTLGSGSRFSLPWNRQTSVEKDSVSSSSQRKQAWYELTMTSKSRVTGGREVTDEESLVGGPESIQVKTSFGSQVEPRSSDVGLNTQQRAI